MVKRFEYDRIEPEHLREFLENFSISTKTFARLFGCQPRRVDQWINDEEDAPGWVYVIVRVLEDEPNAIASVRRAASEMLAFDNMYPERGAYPYLQEVSDD